MTSTSEYMLLYNDLYEQMRKYIWDLEIVEALADVEVECYKRFPDIRELQNKVSNLRYLVSGTDADDEELFEAFDAFDEYYTKQDDLYSKVERFMEVATK